MARTTIDATNSNENMTSNLASADLSSHSSNISNLSAINAPSATQEPNSGLVKYVKLTDQFHHVYYALLEQTLGKGGQGIVCKVFNEEHFAIKLVQQEEALSKKRVFIQNKEEVQAYNRQFQQILSYPIAPALPIALPVAYIRQYAGYVMRLLGEMTSLKDLTVQGNLKTCQDVVVDAAFNDLYDQNNPDAKGLFVFLSFYKQQGSLRLRLNVLKQLSYILGQLHAQDLVFGDLSPNNVLLTTSQDKEHMPQVWLIDVDNIRYMGEGTKNYTPGFAAPEVTAGNPTTLFSDCYAFALLAFKTLTTDSAISEEVTAEQAWLYAPNAPVINVAGSLHQIWLNSELFALFDATFTAAKPALRPPLWQWFKALQRAEDLTIACPHCGIHHYGNPQQLIPSLTCPFCDHSSLCVTTAPVASTVHAAHTTHDSSAVNAAHAVASVQAINFIRELNSECETSLLRHLWGACRSDQDTCVLKISLDLPDHFVLHIQQPLNLQLALAQDMVEHDAEGAEGRLNTKQDNQQDHQEANQGNSVGSSVDPIQGYQQESVVRLDSSQLLEKGSHRLSLNNLLTGFSLQLVSTIKPANPCHTAKLFIKGVSSC